MKKGFILHQFNLRECYAFYLKQLGLPESSAKTFPDQSVSKIS